MKKLTLVLTVIVALIVLYAGWYLASPLFLNKVVNEQLPTTATQKVLYQGSFVDADSFHKVSGTAKVISDGEKRYLRFENFQSTNGPDLKVYLSEDTTAKSYVKLGDLKGNVGDQNYEISKDVDISKYKYTLVWCEKFTVLFGSAELKIK